MTVGTGGALTAASGISNAGAITLSGGKIAASAGGIANTGVISGYGKIAAPVDANSTGTIEATGGKLTLSGAVNGGHLEIGGSAGDNLVLAASSTVSGITFFNAATGSGTLTVKSGVTVTDGANLAIGSNHLVLNGALATLRAFRWPAVKFPVLAAFLAARISRAMASWRSPSLALKPSPRRAEP